MITSQKMKIFYNNSILKQEITKKKKKKKLNLSLKKFLKIIQKKNITKKII